MLYFVLSRQLASLPRCPSAPRVAQTNHKLAICFTLMTYCVRRPRVDYLRASPLAADAPLASPAYPVKSHLDGSARPVSDSFVTQLFHPRNAGHQIGFQIFYQRPVRSNAVRFQQSDVVRVERDDFLVFLVLGVRVFDDLLHHEY